MLNTEQVNTGTPPLSKSLVRRDQSLQPEMLILEQQKRAPHYVMSILRSFDLRQQTWKRLSSNVFPRMRLVLLETFYYPTKNRTQSKMENPLTEPDILPWEKKAGDQAVELAQNYSVHGMTWLKSLNGIEPEVADLLEKVVMPLTLEVKKEPETEVELSEEQKIAKEYNLVFPDPVKMGYQDEESLTFIVDDLISYLQKQAVANVLHLQKNGSPFYAIADELRREILVAAMKARMEGEKTLQETHMEIAKVRAGQKGKTAYDPYDQILLESLGITPNADMITRTDAARNKDITLPSYASMPGSDLVAGITALQSLVGQLLEKQVQAQEVKPAPSPTIETKPSRPMKLCPACAEEIFLEAKYCKHCQNWLKSVKDDDKKTTKAETK